MSLNYIQFFCLLLFTYFVGISNVEGNYSVRADFSDDVILSNVNVCKWKEGALTSASFSFDDNLFSHRIISLILDQYNFKGSFYVIPSYMFINEVKDIASRGHEIGNHSYTHPRLDTLKVQNLEYEILKGKETIENTIGKPCLSFAAPYHVSNKFIKGMILKHHLFIRNESEYNDINRYRLNLGAASTISYIMPALFAAIRNKNMLLITGHGVNDNGYSPMSSGFLRQVLDTIKYHSNRNEIWVGTLSEVAHYESLFHEIRLDKRLIGDTIIVNINGYQDEKYKNIEKSPISIEFAQTYNSKIQYLGDDLLIEKNGDSDIVTVDLKKTRVIKAVILNGLYMDYKNNKTSDLTVFPNPTIDKIKVLSINPIVKIEVYNTSGRLLLYKIGNIKELDTSPLNPGIYFLKIFTTRSIITKKLMVN